MINDGQGYLRRFFDVHFKFKRNNKLVVGPIQQPSHNSKKKTEEPIQYDE